MAHALTVQASRRPLCRRCGHRHNSRQRCVGVRLQVETDGANKGRRKLLPKVANLNNQKPQEDALVLSLPTKRTPSKSSSPVSPGQIRFPGLPKDAFRPEPFNAYPIPTVGVVHRMTEYFLQVWAPQQGKPFGLEGHSNPYLSLFFPYALQDALVFESIVAVCRASQLLEQNMDVTNDRAFAFHHQNAQMALQKRLDFPETQSDDTSLLTLAALATIDYTIGEHSKAQRYLTVIRQMTALRGGLRTDTAWNQFITTVTKALEALWGFVLSNLNDDMPPSTPSSLTSSATLNSPKYELPVYASHPFSAEFCENLAKVPQAISDMAVKGLLSIQVVRVIGQIPRKMRRTHNDSGTPTSSDPSTPNSVTHPDLHQILTELLRLSSLVTLDHERILTHGLIAYCLPLQYGVPLSISSSRTLEACVDGYMAHEVTTDEINNKSIIWVSIVIATAVEMRSDGSSASGGVLDQALIKFPEMRRWDKVERILQKYLWHDDLAPYWQECWQNAMNRRTHPRTVPKATNSQRSMALDAILNKV